MKAAGAVNGSGQTLKKLRDELDSVRKERDQLKSDVARKFSFLFLKKWKFQVQRWFVRYEGRTRAVVECERAA